MITNLPPHYSLDVDRPSSRMLGWFLLASAGMGAIVLLIIIVF